MKKNIIHIIYSGLGGHGEYVMNLVETDTSHLKFVFFGVEPVRDYYKDYCEEKRIEYCYVKKTKGFRWILQLMRLFRHEKNACFVVHSSIALIPVLAAKAINRRPENRVIFVEHQPNHLKTKMDWRCSGLANKYSDKTVFLTQESYEEVEKHIGSAFKTGNKVIISTGVDTEYWKNAGQNFSSSDLVLGMQARMMATKNFQCLIAATAQLVNSGVKNIKLRLAGDGDLRPELEQLANELGMRDYITFEGMLGRDELKKFMSGLTLYVHSTKGETFSTSILQAMSMQLPIIASDVKGVNNILAHDDTALLFKDGNVDELVQKINLLAGNAGLQKRLSDSAYRLLQKKYTLEAMRRNFRDLMD
jgi:glycosyltransferase involved in cell wall biosynthesis